MNPVEKRLDKAERHLRKARARLVRLDNTITPKGVGPLLDAIERGISSAETAKELLRRKHT
jgi:hypothetical protein